MCIFIKWYMTCTGQDCNKVTVNLEAQYIPCPLAAETAHHQNRPAHPNFAGRCACATVAAFQCDGGLVTCVECLDKIPSETLVRDTIRAPWFPRLFRGTGEYRRVSAQRVAWSHKKKANSFGGQVLYN